MTSLALGRVISSLISTPSWDALLRFAMFPKYVLTNLGRGGRNYKGIHLRPSMIVHLNFVT